MGSCRTKRQRQRMLTYRWPFVALLIDSTMTALAASLPLHREHFETSKHLHQLRGNIETTIRAQFHSRRAQMNSEQQQEQQQPSRAVADSISQVQPNPVPPSRSNSVQEIRALAERNQRALDSELQLLQDGLGIPLKPQQKRCMAYEKRLAEVWDLATADTLHDFFGQDVSWRFYDTLVKSVAVEAPDGTFSARVGWDTAKTLLMAASQARLTRPKKKGVANTGEKAEAQAASDVDSSGTNMPRVSRSKQWTPDDIKRAFSQPPALRPHDNITDRSNSREVARTQRVQEVSRPLCSFKTACSQFLSPLPPAAATTAL